MKWNNEASNGKVCLATEILQSTACGIRTNFYQRWCIDAGNTNKIIFILHWDNATHYEQQILAGHFVDFSSPNWRMVVLMGEPETILMSKPGWMHTEAKCFAIKTQCSRHTFGKRSNRFKLNQTKHRISLTNLPFTINCASSW